jgi:hypothetical protein
MPSSGMLCCVGLLTTEVSEKRIASIIRVKIIGELVFLRSVHRLLVTANVVPDDGSDTFLRNVCSYKSHTA